MLSTASTLSGVGLIIPGNNAKLHFTIGPRQMNSCTVTTYVYQGGAVKVNETKTIYADTTFEYNLSSDIIQEISISISGSEYNNGVQWLGVSANISDCI